MVRQSQRPCGTGAGAGRPSVTIFRLKSIVCGPALWVLLGLGSSAVAQSDLSDPPKAGNASRGRQVTATAAGKVTGTDPLVARIFLEHNKIRAKRGLGLLTGAELLSQAAGKHARDMAEHRRMEHQGSDGSDVKVRVEATQYPYQRIGENIAYGFRRSEDLMKAWMESPGHRENILGDFEEAGIAYAVSVNGQYYWCVVLGTPRSRPSTTAATTAAASGVGSSRAPLSREEREKRADAVFEAHNAARAEAKLPPLMRQTQLDAAARLQARDMAQRGVMSHAGSDQSNVAQRIRELGYRFRSAGENVASGTDDPDRLMRNWMSSPGHKKNILGKFTQIGISCETGEKGIPYWCVTFGMPMR